LTLPGPNRSGFGIYAKTRNLAQRSLAYKGHTRFTPTTAWFQIADNRRKCARKTKRAPVTTACSFSVRWDVGSGLPQKTQKRSVSPPRPPDGQTGRRKTLRSAISMAQGKDVLNPNRRPLSKFQDHLPSGPLSTLDLEPSILIIEKTTIGKAHGPSSTAVGKKQGAILCVGLYPKADQGS
jgi:hypothetical protein